MNPSPRALPAPAHRISAPAVARLGLALLGAATISLADGPVAPKADCERAVSELLKRRERGDLSADVLSELAGALDCSGRVEEALGATFMEFAPDTTGRMGLMLVRIRILRELGLDDVARKTEEDLGIALDASDPAPGQDRRLHWTWDTRPSISGSVAWIDQVDRPHSAILPLRYSALIDTSEAFRTSSKALLPATDSIVLEGGSIQVAGGLSWGGWSESGGFSVGPSGSAALPDDSTGWRSMTGGIDLNLLYAPLPSLSFLANLSASRSWFKVETGPMPTQDEFIAALNPTWKVGHWSFGAPQSIRTLRTNSDSWGWTGAHSASIGRTVGPWLNLSLSGTGTWYRDPTGSSDVELEYQVVIPRHNLTPSQSLYPAGSPTLQFLDSAVLGGQIQMAYPSLLTVPSNRDQSWLQAAFGAAASAGPWHGLTAGLSATWSETRYLHDQAGYFVNPVLAYSVDTGIALVIRDTASGQDYIVRSISPRDSALLVPLFWNHKRRDQCWTLQTTLTWKPKSWLSLRASWTWTRNISDLEDYVDGASYVRNVVSLSSSVSW